MKIILTLLLWLAASCAGAQSVYRCGSAYSESPCPQARTVDVSDARSNAQRAEAVQVAADEKRLGTQMERDRLALLATQKPLGATSLSGTPPASAKPAERNHAKKLKKAKKPRSRS